MDREVRDLERQEKKLEMEIKALAKKGDRRTATSLVRTQCQQSGYFRAFLVLHAIPLSPLCVLCVCVCACV